MRLRSVILVTIFAAAVTPTSAFACSCGSLSVDAPVPVFVSARAVGVREVESEEADAYYRVTDFVVAGGLGGGDIRISVRSGSGGGDCGIPYELGAEHDLALKAAPVDGAVYWANSCSPTLMSSATENSVPVSLREPLPPALSTSVGQSPGGVIASERLNWRAVLAAYSLVALILTLLISVRVALVRRP